ncbi:hypothetical protein [Helicobacter cinaedi]|uniref:Uncharacterized protein n=1 Tax=Helicobacter cinaedi TaxID=213 RepID=A0A377JP39_9HELI|nr:hypothetical protein [Helicobacter cinaedi]STP09550.1 Uncharacterised protein [Helicobacter cinaedi]
MDIKGILQAQGIQTRIVSCEIEVAFAKAKENLEAYRKEFVALSQHRYGSITQWLNKNKSKNRLEDTDEVLLELLVELYQKVENIEQFLLNKSFAYVPLSGEGIANFVGHSVLCMPENVFEKGQEYYLRIFLNAFPKRYVGIFAKAIDERIVVFTQIHQSDVVDFDSFVAQMERLMILDSKSAMKGVE